MMRSTSPGNPADDIERITLSSMTIACRPSEARPAMRALMTEIVLIAQIFSHTPSKTKSPRCANTAGKGKGRAPLEIELNSKLHSFRISNPCYNPQATMNTCSIDGVGRRCSQRHRGEVCVIEHIENLTL